MNKLIYYILISLFGGLFPLIFQLANDQKRIEFEDEEEEIVESYEPETIKDNKPPLREEEIEEVNEESQYADNDKKVERDFVVTMSADFNDYRDLCNRYCNIGSVARFRDSFESGNYKVPNGKRLHYVSYKNVSNKVTIHGGILVEVYSESGSHLAEHDLKTCGEFNINGGETFTVNAYTITKNGNDDMPAHFELKCYFKEYTE